MRGMEKAEELKQRIILQKALGLFRKYCGH
jgi:hypothetical protein